MEKGNINTGELGKEATPEAGTSILSRIPKVYYYEIVWQQLRKNPLAVAGMWCISILVIVATFVPALALDKPFYYSYGGKTTWPFFVALFDRNFFENGVDIFFNLLMVLSPIYLISFIAIKKSLGPEAMRKHLFRIIYWICSIHVIIFALLQVNPYTRPYRDYKWEVANSITKGEQISYAFPLIRYSYRETDISSINPRSPSSKHFLGTDKEGRDVFVRMLYGTRISLTIGIVAVSIYVFIGIVIGAVAGYFGGWVDLIISRFIEVMMCFPSFFLILTIAAFIEKRSIFHIMIIIGITSWTGVARLVRGEFLRQRAMDYVQAAIALGMPAKKIIFGHVLPNAISPVLVSATFGIASAILTESSLAFLGLGDTSAPSWGELLNVGRVERKMWLILSPGMAIFFVVSVFNLVGEGLRDALDPKLRQ